MGLFVLYVFVNVSKSEIFRNRLRYCVTSNEECDQWHIFRFDIKCVLGIQSILVDLPVVAFEKAAW